MKNIIFSVSICRALSCFMYKARYSYKKSTLFSLYNKFLHVLLKIYGLLFEVRDKHESGIILPIFEHKVQHENLAKVC